MSKRIFDFTSEDVKNSTRESVIKAIRDAEGRCMMVETVSPFAPAFDTVSNPELAAGLGADLITLNVLDLLDPYVTIIDDITPTRMSISDVKKYTGRLIGCNLEPVSPTKMLIGSGRTLTEENVTKAVELGLNYIMITGNPGMNVSQEDVLKGIKIAREVAPEMLIIAGKMHGGGVGNDYSLHIIKDFAEAGADVALFPAPYSTPGVTTGLAQEMMQAAHEAGLLGLFAIGTSQEGATESYIERVTMECKAAGADIVHIGDSGGSGIATPENIVRMGTTLRGRRHQLKRMVNRR